MKILWLCNIKLPIVASLQNIPPSPYGGWLDQVSKELLKLDNELCILYPSNQHEEGQEGNLSYLGFESLAKGRIFTDVLNRYHPDIVHIWGTEFKHSFIMTECLIECGMIDRGVISIQGLVSVIAKHYISNLPWKVVYGFSLRDLIKRNNVYRAKKTFVERGKYEEKAIKNIKNIIGRTDLDKAYTQVINPDADYYFCNETLRESFYKATWSLDKCERYSIFVSQASYPVKGFHVLLQALPEIIKHFPETKVFVAGHDPTYLNAFWKEKLRSTYYGTYLSKIIRKNNLQDRVVFTGPLNESQMQERYLKSHVFVSASSIENSPNSVGEAMLLGMPCVSSYVGGVANMLADKNEGFLFQADASYMLAYYVKALFSNDSLSESVGINARKRAQKTHSLASNMKQLLKIYFKLSREE